MTPTQRARHSYWRRAVRITARGYVLLAKHDLQTIAAQLVALRTAITASDAAGDGRAIGAPAPAATPATDQQSHP